MGATDPDLAKLRRVVYRHSWSDLQQWADAIARLGELSDAEIERIAGDNGAVELSVAEFAGRPLNSRNRQQ